MRRLGFITSSILYLATLAKAYAQATPTPNPSAINVSPPVGKGFPTLGSFVSNALTISFAVAILVVLVMLIWGAFEWITSGGDKETVGKARGRIINALIGLAVLAIAFALARVAAQFLGFDIGNIDVPKPPTSAPGF